MHFLWLHLFAVWGLPEPQEQSLLLVFDGLLFFCWFVSLLCEAMENSDFQHPVMTSWPACVCCGKGCCGCGPASCWPLSFLHRESWWAVGPFSPSPCHSISETLAPLHLFQVEEVISIPAFHARQLVRTPGWSCCCSPSRLQLHCILPKMGRPAWKALHKIQHCMCLCSGITMFPRGLCSCCGCC